MKSLLVSIVAALLLVGCGEVSQTELLKDEEGNPIILPAEPVAEVPEQSSEPLSKATILDIREAIARGNIEAIKQHLTNGADVNAMSGKYGVTPLLIAAVNGQKAVAELLITKGANVNMKAEDGMTPLHGAAFGIVVIGDKHQESVELLIVKGADVNAKNKDGKTPLDVAIQQKKTEIADLLRKHGGKTSAKLKVAEPVSEAAQPKPSTVNPANSEVKEGTNVYEVKAGDNLYNIAKVHKTTVKAIRNTNNLKTTVIHPSQKLHIPQHGGKTGEELKAEGN